MKFLLENIRKLAAYQRMLEALETGKQFPGLALPRAARLPIVAALHADLGQPIVLVTDRADHALQLHDELAFWLPEVVRYIFSEPNPLFYENAAWGSATRRERLQTLTMLARYHLPFAEKPSAPPVIVTSARALMTRTLPRRDFLKACKLLKAGQSIPPGSLLETWVGIGYQPADTVLEPGQFSHRGGLLDVWPQSEPGPVRLDFFGDEIDTIRRFDPASQRTVEKLESILVTPAREYLIPNPELPDSQISEFHIPLLHQYPSSLLDYLPQKTLLLVDDLGILESAVAEIEEQAVKLRAESVAEGTLAADFPVPYITWPELAEGLQTRPCLELGRSTADEQESRRAGEKGGGWEEEKRGKGAEERLAAQFGHIERFGGRLKPFIEYLEKIISGGNEVVVVSRQASRLEELWAEKGLGIRDQESGANPKFVEASLSEGWSLVSESLITNYLITDSEIFGWERPQPRQRPRPFAETPEAAYADLNPGDWVVHVDYGVGHYVGLVQRMLEGLQREFLCVEYRNGDQVFVPIHQADRLTRYIGPDGSPPAPGNLGTQEWSETRRKVREAVQEVARELLDLYARRQVARGFAFSPDNAWQGELESSFPYIETGDQVKALAAIKSDMEADRPMDRLLCGDVGYGKTEVALRAAFKAVMDGKQAAVLVPTTVLAQQHYDTFRQRLSAFPVTVEMLSRFRTPREQNRILYALADGAVDIVVGTHRLISADVQFKDLGLVVIDEEQRFGVTHKEHLKELRTEVDVLTLTATPIPRTLYMALTGVRDISNLNTPPEERLPIVTHVGPYSPKLVRQAILRELERGGQVFFVHNRVQTIDAMRMHLEKLVPEARIAIGHGQMPETELASVMHHFNAGEVDILLCTTIIESGLDIPNANTLIVDRGDAFGLAQLYQLRGRVGRGAARAYAYFFRHNKLRPTPEGQERLEIIAENTQLGAGYSIAMRDLEMRGAGELLGTRQSGYIASVGFHLYTRLLAAAVRSLRVARLQADTLAGSDSQTLQRNNVLTFDMHLSSPINVDLPLAAGIPSDYVPDQNLRLRLYRRLADLTDESALEALSAEFSDRFGPPPEMVANLFYQMRVKMRAEQAGLVSIGMESGQIVLRYPAPEEKSTQRLPDLGPGVRGGKSAYWCMFGKDADWEERLLDVLEKLVEKKPAGR
ncbi:MAG: transcription-repair coupling factor (superfamily II helicase) [Anaerolineaceae bacterium]|nr:MAG: transcription-repair coupling factor (superfamily II helicase) [Anaerolineaceae bacterium]